MSVYLCVCLSVYVWGGAEKKGTDFYVDSAFLVFRLVSLPCVGQF